MKRPAKTEYPEFMGNYVDLVKGDPYKMLDEQIFAMQSLLTEIPEDKECFTYAPGKWTVQEVVGHIIDTERVMAYRALCVARGDNHVHVSMQPEVYVKNGNFEKRPLRRLGHEFAVTRESNIILFQSFDESCMGKVGKIGSEYSITVKAMIYACAGHAAYHMRILRSKYLTEF